MNDYEDFNFRLRHQLWYQLERHSTSWSHNSSSFLSVLMIAESDIFSVENRGSPKDAPLCISTTSYGGRGVFSTCVIPKHSCILTCQSPYASVLYRDFRKEVCAFCFAYAFEAGRSKPWQVKAEGVWFCMESCKSQWDGDENVGWMLGLVNKAFEGATKKTQKACVGGPGANMDITISDEPTQDELDSAWQRAETAPRANRQGDYVHLDDMELEIARFVSSGILMRYIEDSNQRSNGAPSSWSNFLQLQNNELLHIRARPYVLKAHIRIYRFLCAILPASLRPYLITSETVRAILGRDPGNSFGIWQTPSTEDNEMFGWAMYPSASFFNHSASLIPLYPSLIQVLYPVVGCAPNVRKERIGRSLNFYTVKDVQMGEELCISYISTDDRREERRQRLSERWYFVCNCVKCESEDAMHKT
jgi:hypothetical protein